MSNREYFLWVLVIIVSSLPMVVASIRYLLYGFSERDMTASITLIMYVLIGIAAWWRK